MKKNYFLAWALVCLLSISSAHSQLLIQPHTKSLKGDFDLIPSFSIAEVEYDVDGGGDTDIDRFIIGVGGVYGISETLDAYLELGYTLEAELDSGDDDTGFVVGAGLKGVVYRQDRLSIIGRAGARYIDEEYGGGVEGTIVDLEVGAVARYAIEQNLVAYGGVDLYPISEGEVESGGLDFDIERESIVGARIGIAYRLDNFSINGEAGLIGEKGFALRVKVPL